MSGLLSQSAAVYALTPQGALLGRRIADTLGADLFLHHSLDAPPAQPVSGGGAVHAFTSLSELVADSFPRYRQHIFICAAGIVLRCIAAHIVSKTSDPAVVVLDQRGRFVVSLLSGHLGGANELARRIAASIGGEAVITTATDSEGLPSLDELAARRGLAIRNPEAVKAVNAALLRGEKVDLYDPCDLLGLENPEQTPLFRRLETLPEPLSGRGAPLVAVTCRDLEGGPSALVLHPPLIHAGTGCRRGASGDEILAALRWALAECGLAEASLAALASADIKRDEAGLLDAAARLGLAPCFFSAEELAAMPVTAPSPKAKEVLGVDGVCEAAALLLAKGAAKEAAHGDAARAEGSFRLVLPKQIHRGVTVALAEHIPGRPVPQR